MSLDTSVTYLSGCSRTPDSTDRCVTWLRDIPGDGAARECANCEAASAIPAAVFRGTAPVAQGRSSEVSANEVACCAAGNDPKRDRGDPARGRMHGRRGLPD